MEMKGGDGYHPMLPTGQSAGEAEIHLLRGRQWGFRMNTKLQCKIAELILRGLVILVSHAIRNDPPDASLDRKINYLGEVNHCIFTLKVKGEDDGE